MAYFTPYIDATGLHIPTYIDIRDQLITDAKTTFGQDIYLGEDSQDYQWIATVAEKIFDAFQLAQLVYNNRGPSTAVGSGLDSIVKINGIKRDVATYSVVPVIINGTTGTVIANGIVVDKSNIKWNLPATVTVPAAGTITVNATCQIPGPIIANIGDIIGIFNPTYGWTSVTNDVTNTVIGVNVETDIALRKRQSVSTANPSRTVLEGTKGAIAQITGVNRYKVYENYTNTTDSDGLPPHSITAVVEGGADADIAEAIFLHKGPGCLANGTTSVNVTDTYNQVTTIGFTRPSYVDIDVVVNVKKLSGYTTATTDSIKANLASFLNSLDISSDLAISSLWGASLTALTSLTNPNFSITSLTAARHGNTQGTADLPMAYNEICRGNTSYITVNAT